MKKHLSIHKIKKYKIILEPLKKNTAPAILMPALIKDINSKQSFVFFSSDNLMDNVKEFNQSLITHKNYLNDENIFIFGIKSKSPSSEYGYFITKKTSHKLNKVHKFIEKPNKNKIKIIIKNKGYMNSGMFFIRKDSIIKNFKKYQKNMFDHCSNSLIKSKRYKNVYFLNKKHFGKIKEISFDYAILEKSKNINAIKLNINLTDLGNWKEIWRFFKKKLNKKNIKKRTHYRPWGKYINLFTGRNFLLKELIINGKSSISLQRHLYRSEKWTIVSGRPKITIDKKKFFKMANESVFIPKGSIHRIENFYTMPIKIIETQIGNILKESDIIRYKDIYGRIN